MFLDIKQTGTQIYSPLVDYINMEYPNVSFNKIYINIDPSKKYKRIDIVYPNANVSDNTLCICIELSHLSQDIIDWLNNL